MGAEVIDRSGLGDELNHVPVDKHTFLSTKHDNIFALGDAAALPTSKAGSVAHFAVEVFVENFLRYIEGLPMLEKFDGHANCFIESGYGRAMLIDVGGREVSVRAGRRVFDSPVFDRFEFSAQ